ncbi:DinB family protein [Bacillus sp. 7884-1]|uniref:DinB family protein n=1 Tax=Bacillus sp. 7884-1 TaxID=2021693 RepID=UPI000BA6D431|nr:DinB family protein [Bacillus sp. 7884-1]PAE36565.1 hypothetical protein CHI06_22385 [Bacillus sp. 7884-1]
MSYDSVNPIWRTTRNRFHKMVQGLKEEELLLQLSSDTSSIGNKLRHNAEVEYMFAEWFFGHKKPEDVTYFTVGPARDTKQFSNLAELLELLENSDKHLSQAMRILPEDAWDISVESPIGPSTPREAIGRLIYHNGLHAGQISLICKLAPQFSINIQSYK